MTRYEIIRSIADVARNASTDQKAYEDVDMLLKGGNITIRSEKCYAQVESISREDLSSFLDNAAASLRADALEEVMNRLATDLQRGGVQ